ncbi:bacterial Ig-like domain-containing protein, partial [Lactococcus petauri]|uniref:bacterial Ig-like domain-containing protein n=1 Tax=Lactococcus petauri TaxID=1940789 RepID=UPI00385209DF
MQMNIHSSGNRADPSFPVYAGGEGYFRLVNTYPGTNKKTVKNSTYTITVPESVDFSTIKNISLIGENGRQFTGNGYDWLNADYSKYLMDTSLYAIISDEETRTITVTIPNTNDWASINSTCFEFTYRVPSNAEGNLNWKTSVYSSGATYETTDTMVLYHDVIIHHVDNEGKPVYENTVVTEKFGTEIKASSYIKNIEGYTYDCVQGETSAIIDSDIKELTLVYNKKIVAGGNITIKYVDEEGNAIAGIADKTITGNIGESYDSTTPEYQISIPGYHLDRENLPDNMTGEFIDQAQEVTYTYIKDKTAVNVHDSTLYVGEDWTAEDNFDSALDKDGNPVDFQNITVSGSVDTSKADTYEVTYSYEGVESKATITVKDKQTAVNVHDSTLYVGEDWTAE